MVMQRTPRRFRACYVDGTDNSRDGFHPLGVIFLKRLNRELELLDGSVDLLRRLAKLAPLKAAKLEAQPLDLSPCENRIPRHRTNDAFECTNVIRQIGRIDRHQSALAAHP